MVYQRGIAVDRNGKKRNRIWWYRFRFAGRFVHESAKTTSKVVARDAERQRRRKLEEKYNRTEKRKLPPTVTEAAKQWLEKRAALEASTRETYEVALEHVKGLFGRRLVCEIRPQDIAAYQTARQRQQAAGATINKEVACLSSILGDYGLWAQLRRDVKRLEENEKAGRALEADLEKKLLVEASRCGKKQGNWSPLFVVTVLGLNTGLRHSEVRQLRWKEVHLQGRVLCVGKSKTDAGSGRAVPLTQPAWAVLDMWAARFSNRKSDDFVFPTCENGKIDASRPIANWRTAWRNACEDAGLGGLRYHDLRHTAATKMLENGVAFATVAQVLGWSASTTARMLKRCGHIRPEAQRKALETVATPEIQSTVNQIDNQTADVLESPRAN